MRNRQEKREKKEKEKKKKHGKTGPLRQIAVYGKDTNKEIVPGEPARNGIKAEVEPGHTRNITWNLR